MKLVFHVSLLGEERIQVCTLLIILVLHVIIHGVDVLRLGITSVFVEGEVVVSQFTFVLAHILDEGLVLTLEGQVGVDLGEARPPAGANRAPVV